MKIAPLHFKINCLAIQQHELINYGNKFAMEIYATVTGAGARRRAPAGTGGQGSHPPPHFPIGSSVIFFKSFQKCGSGSFLNFRVGFGAPLK